MKIFDKNSGKELTLNEVVKTPKSVKKLVERKFREAWEILPNGSLNEKGFWFENDKFSLPVNVGISNDGLQFYYNPYEIGPYAMGATDIILPFSELKNLMK